MKEDTKHEPSDNNNDSRSEIETPQLTNDDENEEGDVF